MVLVHPRDRSAWFCVPSHWDILTQSQYTDTAPTGPSMTLPVDEGPPHPSLVILVLSSVSVTDLVFFRTRVIRHIPTPLLRGEMVQISLALPFDLFSMGGSTRSWQCTQGHGNTQAGMGIGRGSADFCWQKNKKKSAPKNRTVRSN